MTIVNQPRIVTWISTYELHGGHLGLSGL